MRSQTLMCAVLLNLGGACAVAFPQPALIGETDDSTASDAGDDGPGGDDDATRGDADDDSSGHVDGGSSDDASDASDESESSEAGGNDTMAASGDMNFFASSVGNESGDFGGLVGADLFCQGLARDAGLSELTWVAYLSTAPMEPIGGELVHARERIGDGPWFNAHGQLVAETVETLHEAGIPAGLIFDEYGHTVPNAEHDILTGSDADGFASVVVAGNPDAPPSTCFNWTSADTNAWTTVGHADADSSAGWISEHIISCDPEGLASTAGTGRIYCFGT